MIVQCPQCSSDNVTNLSADSNDFICNGCGEQFEADNGNDLDEDMDSGDAAFEDFDPKLAMELANQARKESSKDLEE